MKKIFLFLSLLLCMQVFGAHYRPLTEKEKHQCCGVPLKGPDPTPEPPYRVFAGEKKQYYNNFFGEPAFYYNDLNRPTSWPDVLDFEGGKIPYASVTFGGLGKVYSPYGVSFVCDWLHVYYLRDVDYQLTVDSLDFNYRCFLDGNVIEDSVLRYANGSANLFKFPACDSIQFLIDNTQNVAIGNFIASQPSGYVTGYSVDFYPVYAVDSLGTIVSSSWSDYYGLHLQGYHAMNEDMSTVHVPINILSNRIHSGAICPFFPLEFYWTPYLLGSWFAGTAFQSFDMSWLHSDYTLEGGSGSSIYDAPMYVLDTVGMEIGGSSHIEYVSDLQSGGTEKVIPIGFFTRTDVVWQGTGIAILEPSLTAAEGGGYIALDSVTCDTALIRGSISPLAHWVGLDEGATSEGFSSGSNSLNKCYDCWGITPVFERPMRFKMKNLKYADGDNYYYPLYYLSLD